MEADAFVMATDTDAVYSGWGTPGARAIHRIHPAELRRLSFPAGSMGPKVEAACDFAERTGRSASIGALEDIGRMLDGVAGTTVSTAATGTTWHSPGEGNAS